MSWRSEALRYPAGRHPWLREHSSECIRFLGVLGNQSSWSHAMEHHALLVDALRLYCFKRSSRPLLNTRTPPPTPATMIDKPPYTWGALWNLPNVALVKQAPLSAFFRPLYRPARLISQSRGRYTRYPIVLAPPNVCKLVLADRSRISRRFVLLGPWTPAASFGAHSNFGVRSTAPSAPSRRAKRMLNGTELTSYRHCPEATITAAGLTMVASVRLRAHACCRSTFAGTARTRR